MVQFNRQRTSSSPIKSSFITKLILSTCRRCQLNFKRIQRLSLTRKLALLVFIVCTCTSFSVIFITGSKRNGYHHLYYEHYTTKEQLANFFFSYGGSNSNNNSASRQMAIENAKKETEKWVLAKDADEVELNSIITKFQAEVKKLQEQEEEKKQHNQAKKQKEEESENYYLYYQDNNDKSSTIIGLPSFSSADRDSMIYSDPVIFKRFVGSLRTTGYGGNIIIGVDTSNSIVSEEILPYLQSQNVIIKDLLPVECTFEFAKKNQKCYHPYSHIKREWSYFPLARDWLTSCDTCLGSVVFASVKDTIFQRNPFGAGMPIVQRLHLYELHPSVSGADTSAGVLLKACENIDLDKMNVNLQYRENMKLTDPKRLRILSAGIAVGTRDDIIDYLGAIHSVMREWMHRSQCHFEHSSDDDGMAIVNYLRLEGRLPYRTRIIPHRTGIVNNVGYEGRLAYEAHQYLWQFKGLTEEEANKIPYEGAGSRNEKGEMKGWIDSEYMWTDENGNFIDVFFQKSSIIYEYWEFGPPFTSWFDKNLGLSSSSSTSTLSARKEGEDGKNKGEEKSSNINDSIQKITVDSNSITDNKNEDTNNTHNQNDQNVAEEMNKNDDYYIKDNEQSPNNTTTSTLQIRKIKTTTPEVIAEQQSAALLNSTKKEQDEKVQPIYYKDRSGDESHEDGGGTNTTKEDDKEAEKTNQVVPVEETHENEDEKSNKLKMDELEINEEEEELIDQDTSAMASKARKKKRKDDTAAATENKEDDNDSTNNSAEDSVLEKTRKKKPTNDMKIDDDNEEEDDDLNQGIVLSKTRKKKRKDKQ